MVAPPHFCAISLVFLAACAFISDREYAERLDGDGDGVPRPDDCDDDDRSVTNPTWYTDADGDGFGAVTGARASDGFGLALLLPGDVDDDGEGDLLVGAPYDDDDGSPVYIFRGPVLGSLAEADASVVIVPPADGDDQTTLLAGRMDLDADGTPDFAVAVPAVTGDGVAGQVATWFGGGF